MNCNDVPGGDKSYHQENTFRFRGIWLPPEVIERFINGGLNRTHLGILVIVESLVDSKGLDAWPTNAYLANALNVHPRYIAASIAELKEMGLLVVTQGTWKGQPQRYLRTCWSRRTPAPGGNTPGDTPPCSPGAPIIDTKNNRGKKKNPPTPQGGMGDHSSTNHTSGPIRPKALPAPPQPDMASRLYEASTRRGKVPPGINLARWRAVLTRLCHEWGDPTVVEEVLDWYLDHMDDRYVPKAYSAQAFKSKFERIKDAKERPAWSGTDGDDNECQGDQWGCDDFLPEDQRW